MARSTPSQAPYTMSRATFSTDPPAERETPKKKWQLVQETRSQKSPPPSKPQESAEKVQKESNPKTEKNKTAKEPSQKSEKKVDSRTKSSNSSNKKSRKRNYSPRRKESKQKLSLKKSASREDATEPEKKKNWKKKAAEGFQLHMVAVIVSLIFQLGLTFFIMSELIKASGPVLLFLVGAMIGLLSSLFFTLKVIFSRSKVWILLGGLDAAVVMGLALTVLIVQTQKDYSKMDEKQEQETKLIQRLAAVTIIVMVCHVLAIGNHFYYTKWGNKKKADEEEGNVHDKKESKRFSGGAEPHRSNCRQMAYMIEAGSA